MHKILIVSMFLLLISTTSHAGLQTASYQLVESLLNQLQPIETEIIYREGDIVELPLGVNGNIRMGQMFVIYSQETSRFIGRVEVVDVRPRDSEAEIIEERTLIQPGDFADEIVGGKVAVLGFLDSQGRETHFSRSFQDLLASAIGSYSGFEVIERRQLEQHLEEIKLSYTGLLQRDAPEAGELLGTDLIIVGGVTELYDDIIINARINETSTGRMLASGSVTITRSRSIDDLLKAVVISVAADDKEEEYDREEVEQKEIVEVKDEEIEEVSVDEAIGAIAGKRGSYNVSNVEFYMRLALGGHFPKGVSDRDYGIVEKDFWISETPVTYELWEIVRMWSLLQGYSYSNSGSGIGQHPVIGVNWYDSIVWCNALSEMLGYDPVYTINGVVIKSTSGVNHTDVVAENTEGFRLPTSDEWELAARYNGSDSSHGAIEFPILSGNYWTPGNYASGATGPAWIGDWQYGRPGDIGATKAVAWYDQVGGGAQREVGQKPASGNGLGLFDMSGNVHEWCFTRSGSSRVIRGGSSTTSDTKYLQVGYVHSSAPGRVYSRFGFRLVRTHF